MSKPQDLSTPDAWRAASLASLAPLLAVVGAFVANGLANWLGLESPDSRLGVVGLGIAIPLLTAYLLRPNARFRRLVVLLATPWLTLFVAPHSPFPLVWLSGGVLFLGLEAVVHAARASWQLDARIPRTMSLVALGAGPGAFFWLAAGVVLVNTVVVGAPVRLAHLSPRLDTDEVSVSLLTDDGYHIEGTYTEGAPGTGGVVLIHGVSDGRDRWLPWIDRLREMRLHALRIDMRAHGRSDGAVVSYGQREGADVRAAIAWLRARTDVDSSRLFAVGTSMGGGTVLAASADLAVAGAVVHGTEDETIPIELSRELHQRSNVRLIEIDSGHDEIPSVSSEGPTWRTIRVFLETTPSRAEPPRR